MTYELMAREFPDYVQASLPEIPESWDDTSWHNDTCPSFYCEDAKMTIHIDEEDAGLREFPGSECRFIVTHPDGSLSVDDVLQTNDWQRRARCRGRGGLPACQRRPSRHRARRLRPLRQGAGMNLTWYQLRHLPVGTLLVFPQGYDIYPHTVVPEGTLAILFNVSEYGIIDVLPADPAVCRALQEWKGCVSFSPENDGYAWEDESPVTLHV